MPPKPKALTPARRTPSAGHVHGLQFGVDVERRVGEVDIRIGMLAMQAGRQHLVTQSQRRPSAFRLRRPHPLRCPMFDLTDPSATECSRKIDSR